MSNLSASLCGFLKKVDAAQEEEALAQSLTDLCEWVSDLTGHTFDDPESWLDELEDGVVLLSCLSSLDDTLLHVKGNLKPGRNVWAKRDNLALFANTAHQKLEVACIFEVADVLPDDSEKKNEESIVACLNEFASVAAERYDVALPGSKRAAAEIEEEERLLALQDIEALAAEVQEDEEPEPEVKTFRYRVVSSCDIDRAVETALRKRFDAHVAGNTLVDPRVTVARLKKGQYLLLPQKKVFFLRLLANRLLVRVGGGWEAFHCLHPKRLGWIERHDAMTATGVTVEEEAATPARELRAGGGLRARSRSPAPLSMTSPEVSTTPASPKSSAPSRARPRSGLSGGHVPPRSLSGSQTRPRSLSGIQVAPCSPVTLTPASPASPASSSVRSRSGIHRTPSPRAAAARRSPSTNGTPTSPPKQRRSGLSATYASPTAAASARRRSSVSGGHAAPKEAPGAMLTVPGAAAGASAQDGAAAARTSARRSASNGANAAAASPSPSAASSSAAPPGRRERGLSGSHAPPRSPKVGASAAPRRSGVSGGFAAPTAASAGRSGRSTGHKKPTAAA